MTLLVRTLLADAEPEMRIRVHRLPPGVPSAEMSDRLARFERRFVRAVGDAPTVVRLHAEDYSTLYRSMGPSVCLVAGTAEGHILGTLCLAKVGLRHPRGSVRHAAFATNLMVLPEARHGPTLARLMAAGFRWTAPRARAAFAHVPEGSVSRPERFLKRLGLPAFTEFGAIRLVSFSMDHADDGAAREIEEVDEARVRAMHRRFTRGFHATVGGDPAIRSARTPRWIALRDGSACGCVEDYERAKRHVFIDRDGELTMNHVTFLGYRDRGAAGRLVRAALALTARQGVPRLQMAVDETLERELIAGIAVAPEFGFRVRLAGFALFGLPRAPWSMNSTEI